MQELKKPESKEMEEIEADFVLSDLLNIVIILIIVGAVLTFGTSMLVDLRDDTVVSGDPPANDDAERAANQSIAGIGKISGKQALIASVIVIAVVIGILIRYLYANFAGKKGEM